MMHAKHPEVAKKWEVETPKGKELPEHVSSAKKRRGGSVADALRRFRNEE
ncbi:MAG: hypothetical protein JXA90_09025 [Planctomycetes bacterium]|nr:hypothetical protein [Planctomycetota bacterium]